MDQLRDQYIIHSGTMALLPAKRLEYGTLVIETDQQFYVKEAPFELVDNLLVHRYSSFQARRNTVIKHTGYKRKVPIPIHLNSHFMFPTHAMNDHECCWISDHHVYDVVEETKTKNSCLVFYNGFTIKFPLSVYSLNRQLKRTEIVRDRATSITKSLAL